AEERFGRDLFEARKVLQQDFGRNAADIEVHVAMAAEQEEGRLHPDGPAAVRHQDLQLGEVDGQVIEVDGIAELVARRGKDRSPRWAHHGMPVGLGPWKEDPRSFTPVMEVVGMSNWFGGWILIKRMPRRTSPSLSGRTLSVCRGCPLPQESRRFGSSLQ